MADGDHAAPPLDPHVVLGPVATTVREVELDGEISLYDSRTNRALLLNPTASDVWRLLDGAHTLPEITELLARAYDVAPETIADDVRSAVEQLVDHGLLPRATT